MKQTLQQFSDYAEWKNLCSDSICMLSYEVRDGTETSFGELV